MKIFCAIICLAVLMAALSSVKIKSKIKNLATKAAMGQLSTKRYSVDDRINQIEQRVTSAFGDKKLNRLIDGRELVFIAYKDEKILEIWKNSNNGTFKKEGTIPFTASSGGLGPKLREGDRQIPEGIYNVEYLNPNSSYYLSFKIDYPNEFDRKRAAAENRTKLGGDIFIHGKDVTIGCVPVGDEAIEQLFYLVAKNGRENVRVIISPTMLKSLSKLIKSTNNPWNKKLYTNIAEEIKKIAEK